MPTSNRVLVIDDEPALCRLIELILTREGCNVVSIDGQAAVALLEKDQAFNLVVTDLLMPKVDGLTILRYIQEHCPLIPVIVSTAARDPELIHQVLQQGAAAFLPRPFTAKQLIEIVRTTLNQHS